MVESAMGLNEVAVQVVRNPGILEKGVWVGIYDVEVWRKGERIAHQISKNIMTTEGKRYLMDVGMRAGTGDYYTAKTTWYVMLSATNTTPVVGMTYVTPVFTEFVTFKTPTTTRQSWTAGAVMDPTANTITNNVTKASFTIGTSPATPIYGAALVTRADLSDNTSGDYLLSYSAFTSSITVAEDDVVKVGITVGLT